MPLRAEGDAVIRLRDVAKIELAAAAKDAIVTFNGEPGTFIGIFPTPAANPLDTAAAVVADLPAINASLPEGMDIKLVYDSTETISASISEVFKTLGEAVVIVVIVILLFLGSFRSVAMPIITIPLSLIGVMSLLLALGYSINLLTLLAMVLAIGLVVDDAIVVVENIHRHIEDGMTPKAAAIKGMQEITGPVIAMTITLAAVLAPLASRADHRRAVPRVCLHLGGCRYPFWGHRSNNHTDDVGAAFAAWQHLQSPKDRRPHIGSAIRLVWPSCQRLAGLSPDHPDHGGGFGRNDGLLVHENFL